MTDLSESPSFHVGLAFLFGMAGQLIARHLRVPGIVVLLGLGVLTGPDGLNLLRPESLGGGLESLVAFAVAIILFEGGMALDLREVWHQGRVIRRLVSVGVLVTALGAGTAVYGLLGWTGPRAVLFATLVVVTGPTVIQPLLRRIRVTPRVATILEGEAILGDAIGATLAVVALELAFSHEAGWTHGWLGLFERFSFGVVLGLLAGLAILLVYRLEKVVPGDLRNACALALVVGGYQLGEALRAESGILVAITAGLVVGNAPGLRPRGLQVFKEELTVLLLGLLFVLLAADVRLADVRSLGWAGVGVVVILMFVVRPLNVLVSTAGSDLSGGERAFLAWLAPRGIVAAAVASYFANVFEAQGVGGGAELRALVFLVITVTVVVQGLTGGFVARLFGVARGDRKGWVLLGANALGLALAERLTPPDEVVVIDASADRCRVARDRGFRVLEANAIEEATLFHAEVESRARLVAVTPNEEINFLFARRAHDLLKIADFWVALRRNHLGVRPQMVTEISGRLLFGRELRLDLWAVRLETGAATVATWEAGTDQRALPELDSPAETVLFVPLVLRRGNEVLPFDGTLKPRPGDRIDLVIEEASADAVRAALTAAGWRPLRGDFSPDSPR